MWLVDYFSTYLYGLKYVAVFIAICIFVSSLDDLLIDVVYWVRYTWRHFVIFKRHPFMDAKALYATPEQPLAIMIPAWKETGVIGNMAQLAASTLDYENYHIFVGTYPNDPDTQKDVDEVCARFPNIHKVVCARPGPTSKADCLNNVLDAIFQFEQRANLEFSGFILHDSEDVISSMELRLFNHLVSKKDLIQVPVYPFERQWSNFTSMSYLDEFAEVHGKDIVVREAIAGQVPSAGVGTCFSRRAVLALVADGDGIAFDTQSLTEDYDIGFRLKEKGMKEIFVRFPVIDTSKKTWQLTRVLGKAFRASQVICVREFFPDTVQTAVRQKSRWIIGIVFQGYVTHRWSKNWIINYFLWRDRKGVITNFVSFIATIILLQLGLLWLYQNYWQDAYQFMSIFESNTLLKDLLWINLFFMANRMVQRIYFVTTYYGIFQGLLSIPRLFWGNYINFLANWRAIRQIMMEGNPHRVAWDKTTHDFPSIGGENRSRKMIGQILIERNLLTSEQLNEALIHKTHGIKIGTWLVHQGMITSEDFARALAEQGEVDMQNIDAYQIDPSLIKAFPENIALRYAVLPIKNEDGAMTLASESVLDPISLAALSRKLKSKISYVIVPHGQVTVGLRHWYSRKKQQEDPRALLEIAKNTGRISAEKAAELWAYFTARQFLFAEVLCALGRIDNASLAAVLLQHEKTDETLGSFLVSRNIVSQETLDEALALQKRLQPSMHKLISEAAR